MPRGDGTGPNAMGSGTGRAMGYCSGAAAPGYAGAPNATARGGLRQGRGQAGMGLGGGRTCARRRGRGGVWWQGPVGAGPMHQPAQTASPDGERQDLERQAGNLEASLEAIRARLDRLENEAGRE